MAKIIITISDAPGDKVSIVASPTFEQMMDTVIARPDSLTSAHGYAMKMLNVARDESKKNDPFKIILPKGLRRG